MQRREKYLLFGLIGALIAWYGLPMLRSTFSGPLEEKESRRQTLAAKLKKKVDAKDGILAASAELGKRRTASLPPNDLDAQRLYQRWLTDLAQGAGFGNLKIAPGRRMALGQTAFAVQVGLDADATLEELTRFLNQFRRIDLLHRIVQIAVESPSNQGDPRFKVSLMAEGLALLDAPARERLFPETELKGELSSLGKTVTVDGAAGFPTKPGFRIRIGSEYAVVNRIDGAAWSLTRAVDGTMAKTHAARTPVELAPVRQNVPELSAAEVRKWLAGNPFAKPEPPKSYVPRFSPIATQSILRGTPWKLKLSLSDLDPNAPRPQFAIVDDAPNGVRLDSDSGELSWNPTEDLPAGKYALKVQASWSEGDRAPLRQSIELVLKDANTAPSLGEVPSQTVFLGRTLVFAVKATDDGPASQLKYQLGPGAPSGATIDATTGEVRWTPPETIDSEEISIPIVVTDGGTPPLSTTKTVAVSLQEDTAQFTYLVASIAQNGKPEAWLYDRSSNQRRVLTPGTKFQIADISGQVKEISKDSVLLDVAGVTSRLALGESLRSLKPLPPPDVPLPSVAAEAEIPATEEAATAEIPEPPSDR